MVFVELNNGKKLNVLHISKISVEENDVIYESAKGSLDNIKEHFDSSQEAETRYQELQKELSEKNWKTGKSRFPDRTL